MDPHMEEWKIMREQEKWDRMMHKATVWLLFAIIVFIVVYAYIRG